MADTGIDVNCFSYDPNNKIPFRNAEAITGM